MRPGSRLKIYALILILFFLEVAFGSRLRIRLASPELLLIAVIFFGLHFGKLRGAEVGLVSGLLKDIFSMTNFGVNAFSFLLVGALAGYLRKKLARENFITEFLISAAAVYLISAVSFLDLSRLGGVAGTGFWAIIFYKSLYTGLVAPFLFFALRKIFETGKKPRI